MNCQSVDNKQEEEIAGQRKVHTVPTNFDCLVSKQAHFIQIAPKICA